jgi:response regulator NasT
MSEQEAHRYIEKKAMDTRSKRKAVAERIIKDYENATED